MSALLEPGFEFVFELRVQVDDPVPIGRSASEDLQFTPITGGEAAGPRLTGRVRAGGGDWWVARGDTVQLDARYVLETDDGRVDVVNRGYWRASPEAADRLFAGGSATEEELYYRTAFVFQTDAPALRWLAESQFVGYARPEPGLVCIRVFRLT
ncbi:DUF3237 domain-containing protein [Microbacterium fluvii]|uniref:DUF3237 domain-containing protein n=1 Tax=Microbacterium fluvii TaxID=415215 RepID=A0ABW2HEH6_9MICO|nr:DUF3237 domain-containing protein [Microbacterium fluvii]MCU4673168.1 DUF3237 domain-containing protein [Microbacterium fluvii]